MDEGGVPFGVELHPLGLTVNRYSKYLLSVAKFAYLLGLDHFSSFISVAGNLSLVEQS